MVPEIAVWVSSRASSGSRSTEADGVRRHPSLVAIGIIEGAA